MPRPSYQSIHEAIKFGDAEEVKQMVSAGASVNEVDRIHKFTPLHWAAYVGALECMHWLMWNKADPTVTTPRGWTPAHIAAIRGQDACMQCLINNQVSVSCQDLRGSTPAHLAAAHGNSFTLQKILRANIDAKATDIQGWTPVHSAAFHGRLGCLQFLLRWGMSSDEVDNQGNTPAHLAAMEGHLIVLKYLVGQSPSISCILSARNDNGETPKMLAQRFYKQQTVEYISHVEWERDQTPEANSVASLAFPAHLAATNDDLDQLKMLVEDGIVNINERDDHGSTPLHKAAGQGNIYVIKWLIEMGANLEIHNDAGETAQDVARRFCQLAALKLLGGKEEDGDFDENNFADPPFGNTDGETLQLTEEQIKAAQKRAKKKLDDLETQLELAKENYKQLGGKLTDKEKEKLREIREKERYQQKKIEDLEGQLEYERLRREKLEASLLEYKREINRLTAELKGFYDLEEERELQNSQPRQTNKPRSGSKTSNKSSTNKKKPPIRHRSHSYNRNSDGVLVIKG